MQTIDFLCPENGIDNGKPIKIKVPSECCGVKTVLCSVLHTIPPNVGCSCFSNGCRKHLGNSYKEIWENWSMFPADNKITNGCNCNSCGMKNEYAIAN